MYTLACKDMGMPTCPFVAKGATKEETMKMLGEHVMKAHPMEMKESMKKMTKEQMDKMMMDKMMEEM